jgi:hypothetical protein
MTVSGKLFIADSTYLSQNFLFEINDGRIPHERGKDGIFIGSQIK